MKRIYLESESVFVGEAEELIPVVKSIYRHASKTNFLLFGRPIMKTGRVYGLFVPDDPRADLVTVSSADGVLREILPFYH